MDGTFVPNINFGMKIVKDMRPITNRVLDVHLMIVRPENYIKEFAKAGADYITVHYEACEKPVIEVLQEIRSLGVKSAVSIKPDTICDFTRLPFEDNTFYHVVFDPPHMNTLGENSWMAKKYGRLTEGWETILEQGFSECMRVLKPNGTLIFKWSETDIPVSKILSIIKYKPLYGHKSGKLQKTHWMAFIKD